MSIRAQIERLNQQLTDEKTRLRRLRSEQDELVSRADGNYESLDEGQKNRWDNLESGRENGLLEIGRMEGRLDSLQRGEAAIASGGANLEYSTLDSRSHLVDGTSVARSNVAAAHQRFGLSDATAEAIERALLDLGGGRSADMTAWVEAAGNPAYMTAFAKRLADPTTGHLNWTSEEADAHRAADLYARAALSLSGASSMLPLALDPSIQLTNAGSNGGIRSVCRKVATASNAWNGVTSGGATAEWKVEGAEAADGTPAVAGKNIPVYLLDVDALVSYEIEQDGLNFAAELQGVLYDAAAVAVDAALATGSGSGAPKGIMTALTGSQDVVTGGTFASANVTALQNALPARFQPNAKFMMPLAVRNTVNSFETTNGALRFPETADGRLLNRPLIEDSNLATDMTTSGSRFTVYGNWDQYLMVTRMGASIKVLPAYGSNGRPSASNHYFLTLRVGADALVPNAFRVLKKS